MSEDTEFHPYESNLVLGPIDKQRWIYSCSKQMLDRVIWAYGREQGFDFTLSARLIGLVPVLTGYLPTKKAILGLLLNFLGNIVRGQSIHLVNGGLQKGPLLILMTA